jgi:hypothetical protein
MTLDASGNLGVGTTSPSAKLHTSSSASGNVVGAILANTNQSGSADSVSINFGLGRTVDSFIFSVPAISFVKEQQWTSTGSTIDGALVFSTILNESVAERARIDSSGNLLVGTTSGLTAGGVKIFPSNGATGNSLIGIGHATGTTSGEYYNLFYYGASVIGSITQSGTAAVLYNVTSDQRLKENIVNAPDFGSVIDSIQVRSFDWKTDQTHQRAGFIAQELVTVAPEAVHQPSNEEEMMAVDYSKLVPMLVKEIQSLRVRVAQLETN